MAAEINKHVIIIKVCAASTLYLSNIIINIKSDSNSEDDEELMQKLIFYKDLLQGRHLTYNLPYFVSIQAFSLAKVCVGSC